MSRARGKLVLAQQPLPAGGYWEDLSFMAQQTCELAIKAIYQHNGWKFPFVHDIEYLLNGLEQKGIVVPSDVRDAEKTTVFATQLRYPGSSGFVTEADHTKMVAIAEIVYAWA